MLHNIALVMMALGLSTVIGMGIAPCTKANIIVVLASGAVCVAGTVIYLWLCYAQ